MISPLRKFVVVSLVTACVVQSPRPSPLPTSPKPSLAPDFSQSEIQKVLNVQRWHDTTLWFDTVAWNEAQRREEGEATAAVRSREPAQHLAHYEPGSIEALICSVFGETCPVAIAKARCESGLNPSARNRSGASGLFQIMMPLHADLFDDPSDVFDPYKNSVVAFDLSDGGTNWSAWVC